MYFENFILINLDLEHLSGQFCDDIQENVILLVFWREGGGGGGGGGGRSGLSFSLDLQPLFQEFLMSLLSIVTESTFSKAQTNIKYFLSE